MKNILNIALWEFLEKIKRKSFLYSLLITPIIMMAVGLVPGILFENSKETPKIIGLLGNNQSFTRILRDEISNVRLADGQPKFILINLNKKDMMSDQIESSKMLRKNEIWGYFDLLNNSLDNVDFYSNSENKNDEQILESIFKKSVSIYKLYQYNLSHHIINDTFEDVKLTFKMPGSSLTEEQYTKIFFSSYFVIILLIVVIIFSGGMFVRSLLEEKSGRIIEVMLSSCTHLQILWGKFIGISLIGFLQIFVWLIFGALLGRFTNLELLEIQNLYLQILFFISGYMLFTSLFIGIGSIVNSEHEANQITGNLSLLLVIPMLLSVEVIFHPTSSLTNILTVLPFTAPTAMIIKLNTNHFSIQEIIIPLITIISTTIIIVNLSSKLFRIGLLSTDKRISLKSIFSKFGKN